MSARPPFDRSLSALIRAAMGSIAVLTALQVAARAVRDTLFLSHFPVTALPAMTAAGAVVSIAVAILATRALTRLGPERMAPRAFLAGALVTLVAWGLALVAPAAAAVVVYLEIVALGPFLLSGFWSLLNERFDPRSARRVLGRIAAAGTLGGLAGGLFAERLAFGFGVIATLPALALALVACAWAMARLTAVARPLASAAPPPEHAQSPPARMSWRRLAATPYLRNLALLVLGSSTGAALLDFVFKARVAQAAARDHDLMQLFAWFYSAVALLTFAIQALASRPVLERAGLARAMGTLPAAIVAGGTVAAIVPVAWTVGITRALEAVLRGSLFRGAFELLFTPIPAAEKRATRLLIDVGCDRLGDLVGAGIVATVLTLARPSAVPVLLVFAVVLAAAMIAILRRVQRGYVLSLEAGLRAGAVRLDPAQVTDRTTFLTLQGTLAGTPARSGGADPVPAAPAAPPLPDVTTGDGARAAIAGLADDRRARRIVEALVPVATQHVELLVQALLDPATEFVVRRRIPAVLVTCRNARAVDGLSRGLADARFEVRYRCGRALAHLHEEDPGLWVDGARVVEAIQREAELGRAVWESQRLLDRLDEPNTDAFVDTFLRDRAGRSLEHVFTLLSLVLEREPLRIAFRGLFSGDAQLRGTALEYLDAVLPPALHGVLWPHLEPERAHAAAPREPARDREQVLADLLRSHASIEISLAALRREHEG